MKLIGVVSKLVEALFQSDDDPIEAQKNMISGIQKFVGVYNVFGDKNLRFTAVDFLAVMLFAGAHVYVGIFSQIVYLVTVYPDKVETFKVFNCISATLVPFSKYIFMWTARSRLRTIFEMSREGLSSIPAGTALDSTLATLHKARYVSWFVVFNQGFSHLVYLLVPLSFTIFGNDRYLPTTPGESYGLTPKYETPFYETTFAITTLGTFFSAINQTGYIVLFVVLLAHELGHFYSITQTLNEIYDILNQNTEAEEPESIDEKLKFCIKQHQFLMKFHDNVRELYKVIFGAHFMMMTIVLVTTLQTMNEWDIRNTILTGFTGVMPLIIYCFGGEMLIFAGSEMSTAVYSCGWELMGVRRARIVLLMLCLSQRPLYLTAADIFVMNRQTFGNVAQAVYYAILKPLNVTWEATVKRAIAIAWVCAGLASLPQSFIFHLEEHPDVKEYYQCVSYGSLPTETHEFVYFLVNMILMYVIPLVSTLYCSSAALLEIIRRANTANDKMRRSGVGILGRARARTLKMTVTIVVVFFTCWSPYYCYCLWFWIDKESLKSLDPAIQKAMWLFSCTNSCANPIVYGVFNRNRWSRHNIKCRTGSHRRGSRLPYGDSMEISAATLNRARNSISDRNSRRDSAYAPHNGTQKHWNNINNNHVANGMV